MTAHGLLVKFKHLQIKNTKANSFNFAISMHEWPGTHNSITP